MIKLLLFIVFCIPLTIVETVRCGVIYVDPDATGSQTGSSWTDAYHSLENALQSAMFGDMIWAAQGEYFPSRRADDAMPNLTSTEPRDATFWIPRGVQVFGGFAGTETAINQRNIKMNPTILNGDIGTPDDNTDNSYRVVLYRAFHGGGYGNSDHDQSVTATIDGFVIVNGNAEDLNGTQQLGGGGLLLLSHRDGPFFYKAKIDVANCDINNNTSVSNGGGVFIGAMAGTISNCVFESNTAVLNGGGLYITEVAPATQSEFVFTISRTTFENNIAGNSGGGYYQLRSGGQNHSDRPNSTYITNCLFANNSANSRDGGGVWYFDNGLNSSSLVIANSLFERNRAGANGGAVHLHEQTRIGTTRADAHIFNSTFADNVAANSGGAIHLGTVSIARIYNSILWGNTADSDNQVSSIASAHLEVNIIEGGFSGANGFLNHDTDPIFYDPDHNDYSLSNNSPALDAGWDQNLPLDIADLDSDDDRSEVSPHDLAGVTRVLDSGVADTGSVHPPAIDLGAYERCNADMNRDGLLNYIDVAALLSAFCSGDPDADMDANGILEFFDVSLFLISYNAGC